MGEHSRGSGARLWLFRVLAIVGLPVLLVGTLELCLRFGGFGRPTTFFVAIAGGDLYTSNQSFGERFFPEPIARTPPVVVFEVPKPAATFRVFVLGGSAAMGTPDATFGLSRHLQAILDERYPERSIEVINAAMTAINTHVVRVIARECLRFEPDLLVVYAGNNEVVGPYGPGTVFDRFSASGALVRASIRLKGTRVGQLAGRLMDRLGASAPAPASWGGLSMFLDRRVDADDLRLEAVYRHYRDNLEAVIESARARDVPVVLATVATNLRGQPPFASSSREALPPADRAAFDEAMSVGREAASAGRWTEAIDRFDEALAIDEGNAELHFARAESALAIGRADEALSHFRSARDLDALRFRADSRLTAIARELGGRPSVVLLDGESELLAAGISRDGVLGDEIFFEHVHLRPEGNFILASALAEVMTQFLGTAEARPSPALGRIVERLGLSDWHRQTMEEGIDGMTARPPFRGVLHEAVRARRRRASILGTRRKPREMLERAEDLVKGALEISPDDLALSSNLARVLTKRSDFEGARDELLELLEVVPGHLEWRTRLAFALAELGEVDEAESMLAEIAKEAPDKDVSYVNLGFVLRRRQKLDEAVEVYRRALERLPESVLVRYNLGTLFEAEDRFEEAEAIFREAVDIEPDLAEPYFRLGALSDRRGDLNAARVWYERALERDPFNADALNNLGYVFERQADLGAAIESYRSSIGADPAYPMAYFNLADALLSSGFPRQAAATYRIALDLEPGNEQARANLVIAERLAAEPLSD